MYEGKYRSPEKLNTAIRDRIEEINEETLENVEANLSNPAPNVSW